ncbi:MAG: protein-disulfide reductase DsbD domain-containing protein, partial [Alphaproteobacteria bacterium]
MLKIAFSILLYIFTTFFAIAEDKDISVQLINTSNSEFELKIHVPHGWNLYSNDPGDLGEKFIIDLRNTKNIQKYKVIWPEPLESVEDIGGVKFRYRYYEGDIVVPVEIKRYDNTHEADAEVHLDYSICSSICMKKNKVLIFNSSASIGESETYWDYLYYAFLALVGGFILNFMPCILPILSLKINSMVQSTNVVRNSLYTVLGVIFAFNVLIVITCALKTVGSNIGWGLQFQNPYYISCLIVVLIFFAISVYKDTIVFLPVSMQGYLATYSSSKESINAFITGVVSTMLALPCTAPFLGGAIAFALSRGVLE